jgi:hypothetical protein
MWTNRPRAKMRPGHMLSLRGANTMSPTFMLCNYKAQFKSPISKDYINSMSASQRSGSAVQKSLGSTKANVGRVSSQSVAELFLASRSSWGSHVSHKFSWLIGLYFPESESELFHFLLFSFEFLEQDLLLETEFVSALLDWFLRGRQGAMREIDGD